MVKKTGARDDLILITEGGPQKREGKNKQYTSRKEMVEGDDEGLGGSKQGEGRGDSRIEVQMSEAEIDRAKEESLKEEEEEKRKNDDLEPIGTWLEALIVELVLDVFQTRVSGPLGDLKLFGRSESMVNEKIDVFSR